MKINKIILASILLLAILTLGAVSASDNNLGSDSLSLHDDSDDAVSDVYDIEEDNDGDGDGDDDGEGEDEGEDEGDEDGEDEGDDEGEEDGEDDGEEYIITSPESENIYYLDTDVIITTLELPNDAIGNLTVYEDEKLLGRISLIDGYAVVTLGDLSFENLIGAHYLTFEYESDDDYYVESLETPIIIVDYEFITPQGHAIFGEDVTYYLDLHNAVNGTLTFTDSITDEFGDEIEISNDYDIINGKSNITLSGLSFGVHYFYFCFYNGDYDIELTDEYWVYPNINIKNKIVIGTDNIFSIKLPKDACGEVMFTLYSYRDDSEEDFDVYYEDGQLTLKSGGLLSGQYEITSFSIIDEEYGYFDWEETPYYADEDAFLSFTAVYPTNAVITASDVKSTYLDGKIYKVRVTIGKKAIEDAVVVFKIDGKVVKTTTTDERGYAYLKINKVPGTYKLTIVALGKSVNKKLIVKHLVSLKKITIKKSAKKLVLQANLAKINGKYIKYKWVNFKFNGVKYKAKTNKYGIAKLTITSDILKGLKLGKKIKYQASYGKDVIVYKAKVYN